MNAVTLDVLEMEGLLRLIAAGSAILAATGGACWLLRRRSAELRHLLWTLALASQLVLPALSTVVPSWSLEILPPPPVSGAVASVPVPVKTGESVSGAVAASPSSPRFAAASSPVTAATSMDRIGWVLLSIWSLGALWFLAGFLLEAVELGRLRQRALPVEEGSAFSDELHRGLSVLISGEIEVPMSWGFRRPVILLPAAALRWSVEHRRLAVLHEAAHLQRRDPLTRGLAGLVCAIYWFQPLVWWAARRQRLESEKACDDRVLNDGSEPTRYAELLLDLAGRLALRRRTMAPAMADRAGLGDRLRLILDPRAPRRRLGRRLAVMVTLLVAAASVLLVAIDVVRREPLSEPFDPTSPRSAWSLGDHEARTAVAPLIAALADAEPEVRVMAAWALGEIKDPQAIEPLAAVLSEDDFYLREMALLALGEHEDPRAVPYLIAVLDDPHPDLRSAALWSLGEIGGRQAQTAIIGSLDDGDAAVRGKAAEALGNRRFAAAASALSSALTDPSADVREAVARALGNMRARAAIESLLAATSDPQAAVRQAAVLALGRIGDPVAVDRLIPVLRDGDPLVRAAVVWALDEIHEG